MPVADLVAFSLVRLELPGQGTLSSCRHFIDGNSLLIEKLTDL
ncbi:MAG: hypothetical protein OEZ57_01360 [Nitrospirota bacterium]|nr:hypothetical protein [Nitrospirota bacterium]